MSATVRIPPPLRECMHGRDAVVVDASTVGRALEELASRHPAVRRHLFADDGAVRVFVNVFVNQTDIRDRGGLDTAVDADRKSVV